MTARTQATRRIHRVESGRSERNFLIPTLTPKEGWGVGHPPRWAHFLCNEIVCQSHPPEAEKGMDQQKCGLDDGIVNALVFSNSRVSANRRRGT